VCLDEKPTFRDRFENLGLALFREAVNVLLHMVHKMTVRRTLGIGSRISMEQVRGPKRNRVAVENDWCRKRETGKPTPTKLDYVMVTGVVHFVH